MRQEFLQAERLLVVPTVLRMLPAPRNKTTEDLKQHIRNVLFRNAH